MNNVNKVIVKILTERDKKAVIPYFVSLVPDCNKNDDGEDYWNDSNVFIGEYWYLDSENELVAVNNLYNLRTLTDSNFNIKEYKMLEGVPETFLTKEGRVNKCLEEIATLNEEEFPALVELIRGAKKLI